MRKQIKLVLGIIIVILFSSMSSPLMEEGMYPLSEIHKLELKEAGLKIKPREVYNPDGISLVDALVKVGGCTGAFVSEDGLVLTNHHCAFGAVQAKSNVANDYITKGFLAKNKSEELEAKGMYCKIIESYVDVSDSILFSAKDIIDLSERTKIIDKKRKEIIAAAQESDSTITAEISEMFQGKTYVLFKYKIYKDVRIVYVPPRSIGEFGGETDNWMWPRHTGDFSFVRAYMSPDGNPAEYSPENIPFKPKKHLKVNPNGVNEGDFVFILGYPGRTYRHKTSHFLELQQKHQLPYLSSLYDYQINKMEELSENNPDLAIKFAARIKSLSNSTKNYKGKLLGLRRLSLVEKKKEEEKQLQQFINKDPKLKSVYGNVLPEIENVYEEVFSNIKRDLWLQQIFRASTLLKISDILLEYSVEKNKPDAGRKSPYMEKNLTSLRKSIDDYYKDLNLQIEKIFLERMLKDALNLSDKQQIDAVNNAIVGNLTKINDFIDNALTNNKLIDKEYFFSIWDKPYDELLNLNNPLITFAADVRKQLTKNDEENKKIEGALDKLSAELYEMQKVWKDKTFIPDANSTLRLTYGYIRGYSPADATYYSPVTTLHGIIEKSYLGEDYKIPEKLKELYLKKDFGKFYSEKLKGVPVALLYNTDTSGGNSGSPVLNASGELIGVNFDRAYEATINDYAWSEDYSRSIGVDIRYVLWVTQKIGNADFLIKEMGISFDDL